VRTAASIGLATLLSMAACPSPAGAKTALRWTIACRSGEDEYATACKAWASSVGFRFELQTGDSQLFLTVRAKGCGPVKGSAEANWDRVDYVGMAKNERRRLLDAALKSAVAKIAASCPGAKPPRNFDFQDAPDIGTFSKVEPPYGPAPN